MAYKGLTEDLKHTWREIEITKLAKLLKQSGGKTVSVNRVGNLLIYDAKGTELGYIDLSKETWEPFK